MPDLGKATYILELDTRKFDKDLKRQRATIESATGATEDDLKRIEKTSSRTSGSVSKDQESIGKELTSTGSLWNKLTGQVDDNRRGLDRNSKSSKESTSLMHKLGRGVTIANQGFSLLGKTISLLKWPALLAVGGAAGQGLSALTAGAVALTGALSPMTGALVSAGNAYLAFGQAMGVVKIAGLNQLSQALHGSATALQKIGPEGRKFVDFLKTMNPEWQKLKAGVQDKLFGGMTAGIKLATRNFGLFRTAMVSMAGVMGGLATQAGKLFGSKGFGKTFSKVTAENNKIIGTLGGAVLRLLNAFMRLTVIARPLTNWMLRGVDAFSKWAVAATKGAQNTKNLATFFDHTRQAIHAVWDVIKPLGQALINVGSAGRSTGMLLLKHMGAAAQSFLSFTQSARGKNLIQEWFQKALPPLMAAGRLLSTITKELLKMGLSGNSLTPLLNTLNQLVPVLANLLVQTAKSFGPVLIDAVKNIGLLLGDLAGAAGPLNVFVKGIGLIAGGLHSLLNSTPALKALTVTLLSLVGILSALGMAKFTSQLFGVQKGWAAVTGAVNKARDAYLALTGAESLASKGAKGKAATTVAQAPHGAPPAQVPPIAPTSLQSLKVFGVYAAAAAAAVALIASVVVAIKTNFLGLQDIIKGVFKPVSMIASAFADVMNNISGGALGKLAAQLGPVIPLLKTVGIWLFKLVGFLTTIGAILGAVALFGPFLVILAGITLAIKGVVAAIGLIKPIASAVVTALSVGFKIAKAAVVALIPVFKVLATIALLPLLVAVGTLTIAFKLFKAAAMLAFNAIKGPAMALWHSVLQPIAQLIGGVYIRAFQTYKAIAIGAFNAIKGPASALFGLIKSGASAIAGVATSAFNKIKSIGTTIWNGIKSAANSAFGAIKTGISKVASVIGDVYGSIKAPFMDFWGLLKKIAGVAQDIGNKIGDIASKARDLAGHGGGLNPLGVGPNIPIGYDGAKFSMGRRQPDAYATGGHITSPTYMVGEQAPQHPEYVLATNPAYRSRNLGLWAAAGNDLGVPGFADGGIVDTFANRVVEKRAPKRAGIALFEAGFAESGMRDLAGGDASSEGALQLLGSTAAGMGISPHDEQAIADAFLTKGYWGHGGAISLAHHGISPAEIAHLVQGNRTGSGVYSGQFGPAMGAIRGAGLKWIDDVPKFRGTKSSVGKGTKGPGKKGGQLGIKPVLQQKIDKYSSLSDIYDEYATRAATVKKAVSYGGMTFDQVGWLQQELQALFTLRNLLINAIAYLQALYASLPPTVSGKGGKAGSKPKAGGPDQSHHGMGPHGKNDGFGKSGLVDYPSVPTGKMAEWVAGALHWARVEHGFTGQPTSGYRSPAYNASVGGAPGSQHTKYSYPGGAVDFGGFHSGKATKMAAVNATQDYKWPLLAPIGFTDDGHASGTGHKMGGVLSMPPGHPLGDIPGYKKGTKKPKGAKPKGGSTKGGQPNPALATVQGLINDTTSTLNDIQGIGSPLDVMGSMPDLSSGIFGGRMLDVFSQISDIGASATDPNATDQAALNLALAQRLAVSEAQYPIFRDFSSAFGYVGKFHEGGTVPGRPGTEVLGTLLPGEQVLSHDDIQSGAGGPTQIGVVVHGDIISDRDFEDAIEVMVDGKIRKDISKQRRSAKT